MVDLNVAAIIVFMLSVGVFSWIMYKDFKKHKELTATAIATVASKALAQEQEYLLPTLSIKKVVKSLEGHELSEIQLTAAAPTAKEALEKIKELKRLSK